MSHDPNSIGQDLPDDINPALVPRVDKTSRYYLPSCVIFDGSIEPTKPPESTLAEPVNDWDIHQTLYGQLQDLQTNGVDPNLIAAKYNEINRHVALMVEEGQLQEGDAWSLGVGPNPHLDTFEDPRNY